MATTIGRVEFRVGADGSILEPELRRIGRQAGTAAGKALTGSMNREIRQGFIPVRNSFRDLLASIIENTPAIQRLQARMRSLGNTMRQIARQGISFMATRFDLLRDRIGAVGESIRSRLEGPMSRLHETFNVAYDRVARFTNQALLPFRMRMEELRDRIDVVRNRLGDMATTLRGRVTNAFERTVTSIRNFGDRVRALGPDIEAIRPKFREFTTEVQRFNRTAFRPRIFSDLSRALRSLDGPSNSASNSVRRVGESFRKMGDDAGQGSNVFRGHVARTIGAWTLLVLAIGEGTATLGSGVGASLTALISSLAIGLAGAAGVAGAAIAGFAVQVTLAVAALTRMKDTVPGMQDALDSLNSAWKNAGDTVAQIWGPSVIRTLETVTNFLNNPALLEAMGNSLASITDSFNNVLNGPGFQQLMGALQTTIPQALSNLGSGFANIVGGLASVFAAASPALLTFSEQFNTFFGEWANRMAEAAADGSLTEFFNRALDSINAILGVLGALGGALGTVFSAGAETGNSMLNTLADLFNQWNDWMNTIEGQQALQEWFDNGERIFNALLDLAGDLGSVLGELVTPESVDRLVSFMESLGEFLPIAGQILEVFGRLDILNLFTQALNLIGEAIGPLMPVLMEIADIISENLSYAMQELSPLFERLAVILEPVLEKFGALLSAVLPPLIDVIVAVVDVLISIVDILSTVDQAIGSNQETTKVWGDVLGAIFTAVGGFFTALLTISSGVLETIAALLRGDFTGAFKAAQDMVRGVFEAIGLNFDDFVNGLAGMVRDGGNFLNDVGKAISDFGQKVADVFGGAIGWIRDTVNWFGSLFGAASDASSAVSSANRSSSNRGRTTAFASGGLLNGPRRILAGEAGPEAIVPLNRPLTQVDPSVRWLSAVAQGKNTAMASGGVVGGRSVTFAEGSVVVQEAVDGEHTAVVVANGIAEKVGG